MKDSIQEQLNKFHQVFAGMLSTKPRKYNFIFIFLYFTDMARGQATSQITTALQSLRYDFRFNKARRARALNQRAVKNVDRFASI